MRVVFSGYSTSWKAVKVLWQPNFKVYRQTSILEFFPSKDTLEEPKEEPIENFIVEDEEFEFQEEESFVLGSNHFEESNDDDDKTVFDHFFEEFKQIEMEELEFVKEDGTYDKDKYEKWMNCPICDDCSFKVEKVEV